MYQALYRKFRPRTFDEVVGQSHITDTLKNQVAAGRLSHAYLFTGTRGTGKTTCARILAKAVNCEAPINGNPCLCCKSCLGIDSGDVMDVVEMDAASNNRVDDVRALRDEAVFSPVSVKKRVYIIDEVHMLSGSAFNALLKILEEPPEHLIFILATTELNKVPATILSRCQRHNFRRLETDVIRSRLSYVAQEEGLELEPEAAELLARLGDGALRDALSLLDQCAGSERITAKSVMTTMGLAGNLRTAELMDAVADGDTAGALTRFDALWRDGKAPDTVLNELATLARDLLLMLTAPKGASGLLTGGYDLDTLRALARKLPRERLIEILTSLNEAAADSRSSRSPRTAAELCIVGLCEPKLGEDLANLRSRVAALEARLERGEAIPAARVHPVPEAEPPQTPQEKEPSPLSDESLPPLDEVPWFEEEPETPPEPDRAPEPEPETMYVPAPEPAAPAASDFWDGVVDRLEKQLNVGVFSILSDPFHASGTLRDDTLTVEVFDVFSKNMLDKPEILEKIKATAAELLGRAVIVRLTQTETKQQINTNKLDILGKFGNVTIK